MSPVLDTLFSRLSVCGLPPEHVPGLIREFFRIVADGGSFTSVLVNSRLKRLGWGRALVDETTFQLIVCPLDTGCDVTPVEGKRACSSHYPSKHS